MFIECCCPLYFKDNRKHESMCFGMTIAEEVFQDSKPEPQYSYSRLSESLGVPGQSTEFVEKLLSSLCILLI